MTNKEIISKSWRTIGEDNFMITKTNHSSREMPEETTEDNILYQKVLNVYTYAGKMAAVRFYRNQTGDSLKKTVEYINKLREKEVIND